MSQAYDRAFLIVVALAAVKDFPAFHVFQEDDVEAECKPHVVHAVCFRQVYDTHLRVEGFHSSRLLYSVIVSKCIGPFPIRQYVSVMETKIYVFPHIRMGV